MDIQGWTNEMQGIREMISKFAHIDESEVIGNIYYLLTHVLGVKDWNMKMDLNIYVTWHRETFEKLMMKI